jgi:hypothetical protein
MANAQHLLVPIKVQALVIDDLVIKKKATMITGEQRNLADDGKWSPLQQDYRALTLGLNKPAPKPFYGAVDTDQGEQADQLVLPESNTEALPKSTDRGVYLHWVLPSGLRHSYKPNSLDFPALPDQWLVVRFWRRGAESQTKAWFVSSGLAVDSDEPANLLLANGNKYEARRVGKVVPLDKFEPEEFQDQFKGEPTTITAVGNAQTGSPTFTAFIAENRNILSWHDDLNDLREPEGNGKIPTDVALSYLLLGWYHNEKNEPLTALPVKFIEKKAPGTPGWLIDPPGWFIESTSPLPADLRDRHCLFHGMVTHINYWNQSSYKGPMLGYPGSPLVEGALSDAKPSFKVGIGNSPEDALVSLISSEYSGDNKTPNLWKALEAVIYRQPESLVGSWNTAPRDHTVHQNWFLTQEAGKIWSIRPRPDDESNPSDSAAPTTVKPTQTQLNDLKQINQLQSAADAVGRELAALQQDLYARWWKLSQIFLLDDPLADKEDDENTYDALVGRISNLVNDRQQSLASLQSLPEQLKNKLPKELELHCDAAPRFWTPADPVVVIKNCGLPTKHQFPQPLPCRLREQTVTAAEVVVNGDSKQIRDAAGITQTSAVIRTLFASRAQILTRLLEEASIVEQAISNLVERTHAAEKRFFSEKVWQEWTNGLVKVITWDGKPESKPPNQIQLRTARTANVLPHHLAELWGQQPWSPLFLDWQITWRPTSYSVNDFSPIWQKGEHDYQPIDRQSLPDKGITVRGRSLLSPIDGRIFDEPIETLRELIKPESEEVKNKDSKPVFPREVKEILSNYQTIWDKTLVELKSAGMMGQALTGFHQTLLRRDVTLPHVMPDPKHPWADKDELAGKLLHTPDGAALATERLAPPVPDDSPLKFDLIRAGAFRLDELWLIDDFGQWADLLKGTSSGGSAGQVFHPRVRWHDDRFAVAMPPRVVQPVRLNFRFTAADNALIESSLDPALNSICGWIFYNPLDQALMLCDKDGQLAGELVISEEQGRFRVDWHAGAEGVALDKISNTSFKSFAQRLVEPVLTANPRIHDLLKMIDQALERIRPAAARRDAALFGYPLALVNATLGLELFGKAWIDPGKKLTGDRPQGTGNETLDKLQVRVSLGCSHNTEDGLVGYFKENSYDHIVLARPPQETDKWPSGYVAHAKDDAMHVGFGAPKQLTLLMDPWGSVQAATGIVPTKTITLAHAGLDKTLAQMEASFRIGPVLLQTDKLALPTPAGDKGQWKFSGPLTNQAVVPVAPVDLRFFNDQPVIAAEGRLLLLSSEE